MFWKICSNKSVSEGELLVIKQWMGNLFLTNTCQIVERQINEGRLYIHIYFTIRFIIIPCIKVHK